VPEEAEVLETLSQGFVVYNSYLHGRTNWWSVHGQKAVLSLLSPQFNASMHNTLYRSRSVKKGVPEGLKGYQPPKLAAIRQIKVASFADLTPYSGSYWTPSDPPVAV